ncbi:FkbM family methyltransferase [Ketogulonicigenium vulgare]|uniref:FkbM family methyltransferase n=1 Tax=Ketogulonicigenium vulgare TaxID=92945 RepID=UPI002358A0D2|nr:FkbM family methyltransferase [Ketogulonicigenium vulgare]
MTQDLPSMAGYLQRLCDRGFTAGSVIDVGTCYGTPELTATFPDALHIFIEPAPSPASRIDTLARAHRGEAYAIALADRPGLAPLHVPQGVEGASLVWGARYGGTLVRVETLDRLFAHRDLPRPLVIKTDCQGHDLAVLRGGAALLARADLVVAEANLFHPAGEAALGDFAEMIAFMRGHHFAVHGLFSPRMRPRDGALGQIDIAFVREDGPFRTHHAWS